MEELQDRAKLVDASAFDPSTHRVVATVARSQIEDVMRAGDGQPELVLEIARGGGGGADVQAHTLGLAWDARELEDLLRRTPGENLDLIFDQDQLEHLLEGADVDAHGLRERAAVIAVVAATAAGATAGHASAMPIVADGGGAGGATVEMVSDAASTGPVAVQGTESALISDTASSGAVQAAETSELISDAASTGPVPIAEEATLISDSASTGPVPIQTAEEAALISDTASTGPVPVQSAEQASLISDIASSGGATQAEAEAETASATSSGTRFTAPDAREGAILGGAALLITAAGFAVRTQRRTHKPA
jgi:hypothetical protein